MDTILTSFTLGLLATTSPCVLPLYPGFIAYLSARQENDSRTVVYVLGFFVLAGVLVMMVFLGLMIALLSVSITRALSLIIPLADLLIIGLGVLLLLDKNPFKVLPQIKVPALSNPYVNAFVYGMLYGPIALPCSGPLVVGIFALSLTAGEALSKLGTFFWFGLGFGIPLFALSFLSAVKQRSITRFFARNARTVNLVGGLLLVGIGVYDLWVNWELITAFI
jgi:cytochrome c-type biogenesis protein